jgi:hypothetical protein
MKKVVLLLSCAMLAVAATSARERDVALSGLSVERSGEVVTVSFRASVDRRVLSRGGHALVLLPVIREGENRRSLPPVVVQGRQARLAGERSGGNAGWQHATRHAPGSAFTYTASIPFEEWMEGASLVLESVETGCCDPPVVDHRPLLSGILVTGAPAGERPRVTTTTGDRLAATFPYLLPLDTAGEIAPGQARATGLDLFFRPSSSRIEPEREGNWEALADLLATIRAIEGSGDSRVARVVVAGFASPEGPLEANDRLARRRALAVKEYLARHSLLPGEAILVHNGSEDWEGLRALVEASRMPGREQALYIIDNVPVWDPASGVGREGELMRLDGGTVYRYMLEYLFPRLRHAALVWVYYTNECH